MSTPKFKKPRIPSHYYIWFEPPGDSGEEILHFASERRRIKLKGHSFREFQRLVIPLLDGQHTIEEIEQKVADTFDPQDLEAGLQLLANQNLLEDADRLTLPAEMLNQLAPQLNLFHEMGADSQVLQERLSNAVVSVVGLGGAGASVALSLAASGVGSIQCIDALNVVGADVYLSSVFCSSDMGKQRAPVLAQRIEGVSPQVKVQTYTQNIENDAELLAVIEGSGFVINCLDPGQSSLMYKLNRVCLQLGITWTSCSLDGSEVALGPTIRPYETSCYLCYKMRAVSSAGNPENEFAFERFLDRRKQDDSGKRENLVFGAGIAANLASLEAVKYLSGFFQLSAVGKLLVFNLFDLTCTKHVVLRKPWCPACFKTNAASPAQKSAQDEK
ncbi:MAG TPA: TOMM precursor leader peptide-binding protein [Blastocatellia bacterium]|nr:TOMM precursor leader peptide-binding protein [Blastocatellia bacterium]